MPNRTQPGTAQATTRILITGSRLWTNAAMMQHALTDAVTAAPGYVTIVHGAARGADELAAALADGLGPRVSCESWPADWEGPCRAACTTGHRRARKDGIGYCPAAGAYRNQEMINARADLVLAFPLNESPGTRDCMRRAAGAGIPVIDVPAQTCAPLYSTKNRATSRAHALALHTGAKIQRPTYCTACAGWHLDTAPAPLTTARST